MFFRKGFIFCNHFILAGKFPVVCFAVYGVQKKPSDKFAFACSRASQHELFGILTRFGFPEDDRFHHLSHHAVSQDHDRSAIFISQVKRIHGQIGQLLTGGRR